MGRTLTIKPTLKQHEAYEALRNPLVDTLFMGGGAGGGKSWFICEKSLINALRFPGYKTFIARQELTRLMQSTYLTFVKVCNHHGVPQSSWKLNGQYHFIEFSNGSRIDLLDVKKIPSDPMYERFGSLEFTDGNIEEAGEIDFLAYDVLKSRIGRHLNADLRPTMTITGNPKKNWTRNIFYKPWSEGKLPANISFIQSLYKDNPYTAEMYGKQLSQMSDRVMRERLMLGNWDYDDDVASLMSYDNIEDLFTNTLSDNSKEKYLTADIARYGGDLIVFTYWEGFKCYKIQTYDRTGLDITAERLKQALADEKIPFSHCIVDEDGIGSGIVDSVRGVKGFMANRSCFDNRITGKKENYRNLKTQCAYMLADWVNNHKISIENVEGDIRTKLTEELSQIKRKNGDKEGVLEIESKDKTKEALGRSPDIADTFIFRMYFEIERPTLTARTVDPITVLLNTPKQDNSIIINYE
jgi:hypothetical protein